MEFVDNTGHIFSLPSYKEKPIGYEYEEYSYVFWIDANTSRLSVNNYYSKPIYALYELQSDFDEDNLDIEIYCKESNVFKLVSSVNLNDAIFSDSYNDLNDYISLNDLKESTSFIKERLTNDDLLVYKTSETIERGSGDGLRSTTLNYLLIPIYPIAMSTEEGTWITNIMIHVYDKKVNMNEWCYISVGAEFINEYEELIINGTNMGVNLPKDILKAVYAESLYNNEFNEALYNEKIKEYMLNYMGIKGELGNFNSAIKSLKWFGYGSKLTISKLLKTDNEFIAQYLDDYFDISNDIMYAFKTFLSDALVSLRIMINKETDELYKFEPTKTFFGENKPKMLSLLDYYQKIKIGNHDMPIENDDEKYWYWKPYFDFSFSELGLKLICLKGFYKKYFLPIHLNIHSATLGYRVFANDLKLTTNIGYNILESSISLNSRKNEVEFLGNGIHHFTKQIHYIDNRFNEYYIYQNINNDNREWFEINDTCVNIPIRFINEGYYNCVLLLQKKNDNRTLYESHFSFIESKNNFEYKNFIIYPKKFNSYLEKQDDFIDIKSNYYEYWINEDFIIKLLVNNKWYEYDFKLLIHNPTLDFGTLRYRYYLNEHNFYLNRILDKSDANKVHSLIFVDRDDIQKIKLTAKWSNSKAYFAAATSTDLNIINDSIYEQFNLNSDKSFVKTFNTAIWNEEKEVMEYIDIHSLYQYFPSNYDVLSPFKQIKSINDNKTISFNAYMHNKKMVDVNNIDFDLDFYKILKYHLERNLLYIDGTLLDKEFYQYILYPNPYDNTEVEILIHKDMIGYDIEIPTEYIQKYGSSVLTYAWNDHLYILSESGDDNDSYFINDYDLLYGSIVLGEDGLTPLVFDSISLQYDKLTRTYYEYDKEGNKITYDIYDKLYSNIESINTKYVYNVNLPNINKYKNSIHMFGLYTKEIFETNVLYFYDKIDVYVNGLYFNHHKQIEKNIDDPDEQLKFIISGNAHYGNEVNTKYLDVYGLHWIDNPNITLNNRRVNTIENVPIQFIDNQYGLYVERDYENHYDSDEHINIWELNDTNKYDTKEFTYYKSKKSTYIGSIYYNTLEDFYNNVQLKRDLNDKYKDLNIYIKDDQYVFDDTDIRDLNDPTKYYANSLTYELIFYNNDGHIYHEVRYDKNGDINYSQIQVKFFYNKTYIVRNRFYLLSEYINKYPSNIYNIDTENEKLTINNTYVVDLVKLSTKYQYFDNEFSHFILNQNPSMYWYNIDDGLINSLAGYTNELERYTYNNEAETYEDIIKGLNNYIEKYHSRIYDDENEARYFYYNYLSKNLTGFEGKYRLELKHSYLFENIMRLCVEVIDKDNNITLYTSDSNNTFTLTGDEQKVTLYIQLLKNDETILDGWFIPKLIRITEEDVRLTYDPAISGNKQITTHFLNKEYVYGDNSGDFVYNLYNAFFELKFNIYHACSDSEGTHTELMNSVYDMKKELELNTYLDYDFYLMHDDKYWYCLYISQQTINNIHKQSDLKIPQENKRIEINSKTVKNKDVTYVLKYERSGEEYLLNRLEFVSSCGFNQFNIDDIIACYVHNNDRLPFNPYISSKWKITPMSIGMTSDSEFESNAEMTILSIPNNDHKYQKGYYKATVKYSLDRDIQHQFKNTSTFKIS